MVSCPYEFSDCPARVDVPQLQLLLQLAAFWAADRQCEGLQVAIANSHPVITVWDGERLIGFGRATSDGIYRATLWDVVIHPEYQGIGLGRQLLETLLHHPHLRPVERIYLMTSHKQDFYEHMGFTPNPTTTMLLASPSSVPLVCREIEPTLSL